MPISKFSTELNTSSEIAEKMSVTTFQKLGISYILLTVSGMFKRDMASLAFFFP